MSLIILHTFVFNHLDIYLLPQSCSYSSYVSEAKFLHGGDGNPPRAPFFCVCQRRGGQGILVTGHSRLNKPSHANTSVPVDPLFQCLAVKYLRYALPHVIVVCSQKKIRVRNAFEASLLKTPLGSPGPCKTYNSERQKAICMMTPCSCCAHWLLPGLSFL